MMRALFLYDSVDENVKKVAMAITRGLEAGNIFVNSISIEDVDVNEINVMLIDFSLIFRNVHSAL